MVVMFNNEVSLFLAVSSFCRRRWITQFGSGGPAWDKGCNPSLPPRQHNRDELFNVYEVIQRHHHCYGSDCVYHRRHGTQKHTHGVYGNTKKNLRPVAAMNSFRACVAGTGVTAPFHCCKRNTLNVTPWRCLDSARTIDASGRS